MIRDQPPAAMRRHPRQGEDSDFYALQELLPPREDAETQAAWLSRIASGLTFRRAKQLAEALRLHQRYRFDPAGLSRDERNRLRELCRGFAGPA